MNNLSSDYLQVLAKSGSIDEFILRYTIISGKDISSSIEEYEEDYCNRIKDCKFYAKRFIKDGKINFEDCISSKLPIMITSGIIRDTCRFSDIYQIRFYNTKGEESKVEMNLDLLNDMQAMHGIDIEAELENILTYELERSK